MELGQLGLLGAGAILGFALKYVLQSPKETVAELKQRIQALEFKFEVHKDWVLSSVPTKSDLDKVVTELKTICRELRDSIHELSK